MFFGAFLTVTEASEYEGIDQVFPESIEFEEEVELTFRSELWFDFEYPFDSFCFSSDNKA